MTRSPVPDGPRSLALVLAGGGARAAYEVGVLSAIAERAPGLEFPIVTGVSAGAINAVYLAAHPETLPAALGALRDQWRQLVPDRVYRIRPWRLGRALVRGVAGALLGTRGEGAVVRGLMDMSPLRDFLAARLNCDGIDAKIAAGRLRAVALSATAYLSGETVTFVHGPPDAPTWRRALRHAIFLDALEADVERIDRINRTLGRVPHGMAPDGLRVVRLLVLRPSRDLGALAAGSWAKLPPEIRWVVRGMGGHRATAVDFLSYLLFDPAYTSTLIELGYADGRREWPRIERFLAAVAD